MRLNEGRALRGMRLQVTAEWARSLAGEEHSVLPMSSEVGAAFKPKLLPVTVTNPPVVGLSLDTKNTEGGSAVRVRFRDRGVWVP